MLFAVFFAALCGPSQGQEKTLQEKLGYPRDARLLIVHADDLGVTHSVNAASIKALEGGGINSASLMVPCPWFPEIADYAKSHADADFGLHLTLTSERVYYRWGPPRRATRCLRLWMPTDICTTTGQPKTHINPRDVETEIRAQVARALAMGIKPTHLDSHQKPALPNQQGFVRSNLARRTRKSSSRAYPRNWFAEFPFSKKTVGANDVVIDQVITVEPDLAPESGNDFYSDALNHLQPGVTEFVIHLAYADDEMKAATRERATWGAEWRQRDFNFFSSAEFQRLLRDNKIHLITWREIGRVMHADAKRRNSRWTVQLRR